MNVTLRDVAKSLDKSYGNITYHFPTKEDVITSLFEEMNEELISLQKPQDSTNLMPYLLELPSYSYDITIKYLFFTMDYNELKRNYIKLFGKVNTLNEGRKDKWMQLLMHLRADGNFNEISDSDFDFLIFLSVSVRGAYFQTTDSEAYNKSEYAHLLNQMLKPYLSSKGLIVYKKWLESQ